MDITGVVGFAKDFETSKVLSDSATDGPFDVLRDGMLELYKQATNPARPAMVWDAGVRKGAAAWKTYKLHMRELVAEVKARGPPAAADESIAAHLLRLRDPSDGDKPLDDAALANEFGVYFAAGIESAGNAMTWTTYLISQHPEVEAKIVAELGGAGLLATAAQPQRLESAAALPQCPTGVQGQMKSPQRRFVHHCSLPPDPAAASQNIHQLAPCRATTDRPWLLIHRQQ